MHNTVYFIWTPEINWYKWWPVSIKYKFISCCSAHTHTHFFRLSNWRIGSKKRNLSAKSFSPLILLAILMWVILVFATKHNFNEIIRFFFSQIDEGHAKNKAKINLRQSFIPQVEIEILQRIDVCRCKHARRVLHSNSARNYLRKRSTKVSFYHIIIFNFTAWNLGKQPIPIEWCEHLQCQQIFARHFFNSIFGLMWTYFICLSSYAHTHTRESVEFRSHTIFPILKYIACHSAILFAMVRLFCNYSHVKCFNARRENFASTISGSLNRTRFYKKNEVSEGCKHMFAVFRVN